MAKTIIEIDNPEINAEKKFFAAITELSKATKINFVMDHSVQKKEVTPFKSLQDLENEIIKEIEKGLHNIYSQMINKWLSQDTLKKAKDDWEKFELKGRYYFNPKTGRFLTKGDWKEIVKELDRIFGHLYGDTVERIVLRALMLGKILNAMPPEKRIDTKLSDINFKTFTPDDQFNNILAVTEAHTGELIQGITSKSRKAIADVIIQAYKNHISSKLLQKQLFEKFSELEKDWEMIARTEIHSNFNNGMSLFELSTRKGDEVIYMIGQSGAFACDWCRVNINGKTVVLLDKPGEETITVDGQEYPAVWPGKNNYGKKKSLWTPAMGVNHPSCACHWTRLNKEYEKYHKMLQDKLTELERTYKKD